METKPQLRILNERKSSPGTGLNRRQVAQLLLTGAAAGIALPALAATHPIHKHLASAATMKAAEARAATAAWKPEFFSAHQNETFSALAERIIPGSGRAQVNRFVDLLLSVDAHETQQRFANSLAAFDAESLQRCERPFKALSEGEQNELLTIASTQKPTRPERRRPTEAYQARTASEPPPLTLRDQFEHLKGWVRGAYYSSEAGMRELGWTGEVDYPSFPGCQHPEGHH